jgi:hypothetical protein
VVIGGEKKRIDLRVLLLLLLLPRMMYFDSSITFHQGDVMKGLEKRRFDNKTLLNIKQEKGVCACLVMPVKWIFNLQKEA